MLLAQQLQLHSTFAFYNNTHLDRFFKQTSQRTLRTSCAVFTLAFRMEPPGMLIMKRREHAGDCAVVHGRPHRKNRNARPPRAIWGKIFEIVIKEANERVGGCRLLICCDGRGTGCYLPQGSGNTVAWQRAGLKRIF